METTGTFVAADAFCITGRGWVLLGELSGTAGSGQQLVFDNGVEFRIKGIQLSSGRIPAKTGLLLDAAFASRQQLLEVGILGAVAAVVRLARHPCPTDVIL